MLKSKPRVYTRGRYTADGRGQSRRESIVSSFGLIAVAPLNPDAALCKRQSGLAAIMPHLVDIMPVSCVTNAFVHSHYAQPLKLWSPQ
jgi:hypothetical protein